MNARDEILNLLNRKFPHQFTANQIVQRTGLSFTTVRRVLNQLEDEKLIGHSLEMSAQGRSAKHFHA